MEKVVEEHTCINENRIVAIETRLEHKKEDIEGMHSDYSHLREKLETISVNVVELTAIMRENQKKEDENDRKIDELTKELAKATNEIGNLQSSIDTLKYIIPIACTILTFIVNYLM